jgi:GAF domain-containing protein
MSRVTDVAATDHEDVITRAQERIEELVAAGAPLHDTLEELVRIVEDATASGMIASILILSDDGRHLLHGAGPSLPKAYNDAIDGIEIGPEVGSCGTAAFHDKTVAVYDIATNPLWRNFKDLALAHGLRACWSTPIHGSDGKVLGTFANYYRFVRDPSPRDQELTELITHTAAMAIEHDRKKRTQSQPPSVSLPSRTT